MQQRVQFRPHRIEKGKQFTKTGRFQRSTAWPGLFSGTVTDI